MLDVSREFHIGACRLGAVRFPLPVRRDIHGLYLYGQACHGDAYAHGKREGQPDGSIHLQL